MKITNLKLYGVWEGIIQRCCNPKSYSYYNYGGRGITICDEWRDSSTAFIDWCYANGYKEGLSIDRIDNCKGYSPDNCRFVDRKIQQRNRRTNVYIEYNGETRCKKEWCEVLGLSVKAIDHCVTRYKLSYPEAFDRYLTKKYNPTTWKWEIK